MGVNFPISGQIPYIIPSNDVDITLGTESKFKKKNTMTLKNDNNVVSSVYNIIVIVQIYGQFEAM